MEKNELLTRLNELRKEINSLRDNLNKIDREKESWFSKKESLKKEIFKLVKDLKNIKQNKDASNIEVKKLREERDNYNKKVKELIVNIKELNKNKLEFIRKSKINFDPENIKKRIDALEFKVETEALSINKEKEVMKQIKDLSKIYDQNIGLKNIIDKINTVDKEINENKNKSDELHKKIRELIDVNDPGYKKFKEESNKINNLRKEQQFSFDKFIELKKEFLKIQVELQKKLNESYDFNKNLGEINKKIDDERKAKNDAEFEKREKLVEEKLMTKKKLTKDDLIMLQR